MQITVKNEIDQIAQVYKGHSIPEDMLARWLSDVDGYIRREILLINDPLPEYSYKDAPDTELLVTEAPYRRMYFLYLSAMIDFVNKQYNTYANELGEYNNVLSDYRHYIVTRYDPAHSGANIVEGCYLSAYGLALKYGYVGTEAEWAAAVESARLAAEASAAEAAESAADAQKYSNDSYRSYVNANSAADAAQTLRDEAVAAKIAAEAAADEAQGCVSLIEEKLAAGEFNGYTPQRGIDYYTEEDKAEMVAAVLAALPVAENTAFPVEEV